jgi:hypothetical protein
MGFWAKYFDTIVPFCPLLNQLLTKSRALLTAPRTLLAGLKRMGGLHVRGCRGSEYTHAITSCLHSISFAPLSWQSICKGGYKVKFDVGCEITINLVQVKGFMFLRGGEYCVVAAT